MSVQSLTSVFSNGRPSVAESSSCIKFREQIMNDKETILAAANERGSSGRLAYAGAVLPHEAWDLLGADPNVVLVDVRTRAERDWVGRVKIPEGQHAAVEWNLYPGGTPNPDFIEQLGRAVPPVSGAPVLLFLCRSGVRSRAAAQAATAAGYTASYDILEGFEGDKDERGHRKNVGGWCKAGLPWTGA
jgi:rhodanese-related sulfurtransferase